jgi:hypothetical protein
MNSIHRSSSGCHVAHGDVAPETVVSNTIGETHKICPLAIRQWGGHRHSCRGSLLWIVVVRVITLCVAWSSCVVAMCWHDVVVACLHCGVLVPFVGCGW